MTSLYTNSPEYIITYLRNLKEYEPFALLDNQHQEIGRGIFFKGIYRMRFGKFVNKQKKDYIDYQKNQHKQPHPRLRSQKHKETQTSLQSRCKQIIPTSALLRNRNTTLSTQKTSRKLRRLLRINPNNSKRNTQTQSSIHRTRNS